MTVDITSQYIAALERIIDNGKLVENKRTGTKVLTDLDYTFRYDASSDEAPIIRCRKYNPKVAIAELLGFLRGADNAALFRALGTKTWDANANITPAWLSSPYRKGEDDLGPIYGAVAKHWPVTDENNHVTGELDLFQNVYEKLMRREDDRGLIVTFWNPGVFHRAALRPCMYEHQFSLLDDVLYLHSTQRSGDMALGVPANFIQAWLLLRLMASATGLQAGAVYHRVINAHIYHEHVGDVLKMMEVDWQNESKLGSIKIPQVTSFEQLSQLTLEDFDVEETGMLKKFSFRLVP